MVVSQTYVTAKHVENAWENIKKTARDMETKEQRAESRETS